MRGDMPLLTAQSTRAYVIVVGSSFRHDCVNDLQITAQHLWMLFSMPKIIPFVEICPNSSVNVTLTFPQFCSTGFDLSVYARVAILVTIVTMNLKLARTLET